MLYTITYVLLRFGLPQDSTVAVVGKNQKNYGRAMFEKKYGAHVLRIGQTEWEGGADQNIMKRATRAAAVFSVRVEVAADTESQEAKLEAQIDEQKATIEELQGKVAALTREKDAVAADFETLKLMATAPPEEAQTARNFIVLPPDPVFGCDKCGGYDNIHTRADCDGQFTVPRDLEKERAASTEGTATAGATKRPTADLVAMVEAHGAANSQPAETPGAPAENSSGAETLSPNGRQDTDTQTIPKETAPPPEMFGEASAEKDPVLAKAEAHDAHVARIETMGFPALQQEMREQNEEGAEIDPNIKTKVGLRTALLDWYDRKP